MSNQSLTVEKKPRKRGRPPGSRSGRFSMNAILHQVEVANDKRRALGFETYDLEHFSVMGQMAQAALEHDLEVQEAWEDLSPRERVDAKRISMGLWRELAPYAERKAPSLTVEEVKKADNPDKEGQTMAEWVMNTIRKQSTTDKQLELAAADAVRHNWQE